MSKKFYETEINLFKGENYLFSLVGDNVDFDDIIYNTIKEIVDIDNADNMNIEEFKNTILSKISYFKIINLEKNSKRSIKINIETKNIILEHNLGLTKINKYNEDKKIKIIDYKYYMQYPDNKLYEIISLHTDDIKLLKKIELSYNEFQSLYNFIDILLNKYNDIEYIINDQYILVLNTALVQ